MMEDEMPTERNKMKTFQPSDKGCINQNISKNLLQGPKIIYWAIYSPTTKV